MYAIQSKGSRTICLWQLIYPNPTVYQKIIKNQLGWLDLLEQTLKACIYTFVALQFEFQSNVLSVKHHQMAAKPLDIWQNTQIMPLNNFYPLN